MPDTTKYISKVTLPNGQTYTIKDAEARELIEHIVSGGVSYIGETTTALVDGGTTNPITINGASVSVVSGNLVTNSSKEFLFDGTQWHEVGDLSKFDELGDWAYVDSGSVTITPAGTVSKPTFTGSSSTVTITATDNTSGNYQPKGSVSQPTFSGTQTDVDLSITEDATGNYQPKGTVSQPTFSGTKVQLAGTTTAAGSVSQPTFSNGSITGSGTVAVPTSASTTVKTSAKSTVSAAASGTTTYQPAGTISDIAVTLGTKSINSANTDGVTPTWSASVDESTETLSFGWNAGSMPTVTATTVGSGAVSSYTQPTFTGTAVRLQTDSNVPSAFTTTLTDTDKTVDVTGTATGTVSKPTFTGSESAVTITATESATGNYQPKGTVSQPTFTGTKVQIAGSVTPDGTVSKPTFTGTKVQLAGTTTAAGSVSQPTFSGTEATVAVTTVPHTP